MMSANLTSRVFHDDRMSERCSKQDARVVALSVEDRIHVYVYILHVEARDEPY
jgi:hypothetical protein